MAEPKVIVPKRKDRVGCSQHPGIFEVVGVNSLMQTANLRAVDGSAPVIKNIPWSTLKGVDKR